MESALKNEKHILRTFIYTDIKLKSLGIFSVLRFREISSPPQTMFWLLCQFLVFYATMTFMMTLLPYFHVLSEVKAFDSINPPNYFSHTLQLKRDVWAKKKFSWKIIKRMSPKIKRPKRGAYK